MEPELAALAQSAGAALVAAMATDAWSRARERATLMWQRVQPQRADRVAAELEESGAALRTAEASEGSEPSEAGMDAEELAAELRAQWQGEMRRLLLASPEAAGELRALLAQLPTPAEGAGVVSQRAVADGHGRVYQAGRDQHITGG